MTNDMQIQHDVLAELGGGGPQRAFDIRGVTGLVQIADASAVLLNQAGIGRASPKRLSRWALFRTK